jgi:hypothetical protein
MEAMSTISLQDIGLPPAARRAAERKARRSGQSAPEYLRSLVERDLLADQTFDQILAPVRRDFQAAGVTEEDVDRLVADARKAVARPARRKPRAKRRPS